MKPLGAERVKSGDAQFKGGFGEGMPHSLLVQTKSMTTAGQGRTYIGIKGGTVMY